MRILLDTCIAYAWLMDKIIDDDTIKLIQSSGAYVSPVSVLEMSIKHSLGKLPLPSRNPALDIEAQGFMWLNVTPYHAERVIDLPFHHRDPFDRLIIAQSMHESMRVLTYDPIFQRYPGNVLLVRK